MRRRPLGASGVQVSEIGFGTWGIGGWQPGQLSYGTTDDATSRAALSAARDRGITFFDTARLYGQGHAETLLGETFGPRHPEVVIATKLGYVDFSGRTDFSPTFLTRGLEESLIRLRRDYVDVLMLHDPPPEAAETAAAWATLRDLKAAGKARAIGLSTKTPAGAAVALARYRPDALEVNFNLLDWRAEQAGLLTAAAEAGCGVIARTPLCFGFLTGRLGADARFGADDHRHRWDRDQIARWAAAARTLLDGIDSPDLSDTQKALRFCLSFAAISSTIPGMLTPAEVEENAAAAGGSFADKTISELQRRYQDLDIFPARG